MPRRPTISNEKILDVARQVFLEQGFGASTLEIAERANISEASIFKRFGTKQALFVAAMATEKPLWIKQLEPPTPTTDIKAALIEICEPILAFYQEALARVTMLMAQGKMPMPPPMPPPFVRDAQVLAKYLERAIALGHLRSCDSHILAHIIVGAIVNYVMTENAASKWPGKVPELMNSVEPKQFVRNLIETTWVGIAPPS
jgi:AcrR family transcriptional regulator